MRKKTSPKFIDSNKNDKLKEQGLFENLKSSTLVTTDELAAKLNVSSKTIRKWRYERHIPESCAVKYRTQVRYRLESVLAWLESQQETKA